MKKLLVLMLVPGMASLASATLVTGNVSWDVVGGQLIGTGTALGAVDLALALDTPDYGNSQAVIMPDCTTDGISRPGIDPINKCGVMARAGDDAQITPYSGMWRVQAIRDESTDETTWTQAVGVWFRLDINDSTETIEIWDSSGGWASLGTIALIPEPMTMALLGLGGLFLRRRK